MIHARSCDVRLGEKPVLHDINWLIDEQQTWVVTGPNGAGKSALAAMLAGEGIVTAGELSTESSTVAVVSLEAQSALIERERERDDADLTDQVSDGTPVREMLDETCQDKPLQGQLIDQLGLRRLLDRGFRKLSTGETRKVMLVRALTSHPSLLVLDEPYEGLDAATVPLVAALLHQLSNRLTLVLMLNRLDQIPAFTTHALRLENGRVAQSFACEDGSQAQSLLAGISSIRSAALQLPPPEDIKPLPRNGDGSLVRLTDARVAYTDNVVFEHLNWTISPGEHWQLKGRNGSGKTCLLSLITGDHPQCYVNDIELFGFRRGQGETIWQLKQYMGFVSTSLHWDYRLSVSVKNVIVSGFFDSIGVYQRASEKQLEIAQAWLTLLGLGDKANQSFAALSYGEQRVLLIARAMVKHPPLLLLDEPCLGLDEANRHLVLALINRICEAGNTTLVYVTHHEEDAIDYINNKLVLGESSA